ncbi:response regulator [Azospirillum sp. TSO22-1]|uniref:response regulator n=1 Tax=Azospirillum sp. TSO22-1 TaxID=716789 RepID=UPI000D60D190|nr:response regulator [Azospirillum sp. TSO22-1]PWC41916.1 hypothetical protein TSO221_22615 [Azospirillum sp. TSO22-1]
MPKTILCVDDETSLLRMLALFLAGNGYRVLEAADGGEGLKRLQGETADLVITDLNMPGMDGLAFIRALRRSPAHRPLPILVLSAAYGDARAEAMEAGATAWIAKPVQPEHLLALVAAHLRTA